MIPLIQGSILLHENKAAQAVAVMAPTARYEFGILQPGIGLITPYLRGLAALQNKQPDEAKIEFKKIIDHSGIARDSIVGPLATLGIARAAVLANDTGKARAAYQDFLALWKDADPDIPILIQAKSEYAKLQ